MEHEKFKRRGRFDQNNQLMITSEKSKSKQSKNDT